MRKIEMAPSTKSNGVGGFLGSLPSQMVAIQLKNFTPVGTATNIVENMNGTRSASAMPEVNIWCAQTRKPTRAMPRLDKATQR